MHDLLFQVIFYVFSGLTILSALMVVMQTNPVRCALFLVFAFLTSSVLWILLEAEFLALILVLVYVGAVMTLFLFVVMMLNIDTESTGRSLIKYLPFALILSSLVIALLLHSIPKDAFKESTAIQNPTPVIDVSRQENSPEQTPLVKEDLSNTKLIGRVLYTDYVFAFELSAVLLLVAIISAITLAHRGAIRSKRQNIVEQIMTRREDRVELVKMKSS